MSHYIKQFLLFSATIDPSLFAKCSYPEQQKLLMSGAFVCIPAILALFSGAYAAPLLFDSQYAQTIFIVVYALLIYIMDKALVSSVKFGEVSLSLIIRVLLSIILSLLVAEPLILHMFRDEIHASEVLEEKNMTVQADSILQKVVYPLKMAIEKNDSIAEVYRNKYLNEIDGSAGSKTKGVGPIAKSIENELSAKKTENNYKNKILQGKIDSIMSLSKARLEKEQESIACGLVGKLNTLQEIGSSNFIIRIASWLIRIMLILLDLSPIIMKACWSFKKRENLYESLLKSKYEHFFDAANANESLGFEASSYEQRTVFERQLALEKVNYLRSSGKNLENMIMFLQKKCEKTDQIQNHIKEQMDKITDPQIKEIFWEEVRRLIEEHYKKIAHRDRCSNST